MKTRRTIFSYFNKIIVLVFPRIQPVYMKFPQIVTLHGLQRQRVYKGTSGFDFTKSWYIWNCAILSLRFRIHSHEPLIRFLHLHNSLFRIQIRSLDSIFIIFSLWLQLKSEITSSLWAGFYATKLVVSRGPFKFSIISNHFDNGGQMEL